MSRRKPATDVVHAGRTPDPLTGAVTPPVQPSTTFARGPDGELLSDFLYSREGNPNRRDLQSCLAQLEGGAAARCFASGSAAAAALLEALPVGARVVYGDDLYYGVRALIEDAGRRRRLAIQQIDFTDAAALEGALGERTDLVLVETPSNPRARIIDIAALAERVHAADGLLAVDNTFATPMLQQPLALGADVVVHSTTKYLSGHSDVVGGAVVFERTDWLVFERLQWLQKIAGAVPAPFDCWLTLRGIATLDVRMEAHSHNALAVAQRLDAHDATERVLYPGLPSHPGHEVAVRQMKGFGGMLAVLVRGGRAAAARFVSALELFTPATSLGAVHSLVEHRILVEPPDSTMPDNLVRMSVGIEHADDLCADVEQALAAV